MESKKGLTNPDHLVWEAAEEQLALIRVISEGRAGLGACDGLFWGSTLSQGIYQTVDQEYPKRAIIQRKRISNTGRQC